MKNSIKMLVCALALGTTVAFAGPGSTTGQPESFGAVVYKNTDGGLNVNVEKKAPAHAAILITNENGELIARENIAKKQMKAAVKFDVSALEAGSYTIAVVSKGEKLEKEFTITNQETVVERTLSFE